MKSVTAAKNLAPIETTPYYMGSSNGFRSAVIPPLVIDEAVARVWIWTFPNERVANTYFENAIGLTVSIDIEKISKDWDKSDFTLLRRVF